VVTALVIGLFVFYASIYSASLKPDQPVYIISTSTRTTTDETTGVLTGSKTVITTIIEETRVKPKGDKAEDEEDSDFEGLMNEDDDWAPDGENDPSNNSNNKKQETKNRNKKNNDSSKKINSKKNSDNNKKTTIAFSNDHLRRPFAYTLPLNEEEWRDCCIYNGKAIVPLSGSSYFAYRIQ